MKLLKDVMREFWVEEEAVGVVEIILILVVLISLVVIFKEQLTSLVSKILSKITKQSNAI
ncbi:MAG: Flp1 family type IVb pilin [Eubacteriales bacterium]|nr:Flp1 family type IVb pilin [Eubacteriales bacterium]